MGRGPSWGAEDLATLTKCLAAGDLPAAIANFQKDLNIFRERTDGEYPEVLKLPFLFQMIPSSQKTRV